MKILPSALAVVLLVASPGAYAQNQASEQVPLEQAKTTFLNQFGALGFARLLDMQPQGENYLARVETIRGNVALIEINPVSGDIITMQAPDAVAESGINQQTEPQIQVSEPVPGQAGTAQASAKTCDLSDWPQLNAAINGLDPARELQAQRMMLEVWDLNASNQVQACQQQLQQVQAYVRNSSAS